MGWCVGASAVWSHVLCYVVWCLHLVLCGVVCFCMVQGVTSLCKDVCAVVEEVMKGLYTCNPLF